ncbi:MAG: serine phosphatase [Frankiales bacterium]|nr:serine phosphatase [Frankiales bacterium]
MTITSDERPSGPAQAARVALGAIPMLVTRLRRDPPPEQVALALLVLLAAVATLAGATWSASVFPPVFMALPLLLGGLVLQRRAFRQLAVVVGGCLAFDLVDVGVARARPGSLVVVLVTGIVAYEFARSREETGLGGLRGDSVLVELKRRLDLQGDLPPLPAPWCAEVVVKPAGGGPFAGDFVVSSLTDDRRFEVALVDVSGKGVEAGTRALLLSGALGGLLGAELPQDYLPAANSYLMRQDWEEGFATAVHLTVDLESGEYTLGSAGHPPVAHFDAGSGRWGLDQAHGPALGLLADAQYSSTTGVLRPGDALLLYTDGLVEVPGRDLEVGIDKLLGEAERLVTGGFEGGGVLLVDRVAAGSSDDRGLVLIWRSHQ